MDNNLREELIQRYEATGKVGFSKPKSFDEALELIDTVVSLYEQPEPVKPKEEVVINLSDLTEKLRTFFEEL